MKEQAVERTRRKLIESATAVLAKNSGASMGQIAEAAGVGRATLHRYFARREDLLTEIALEALRRTDEAVAPVLSRATTALEILRLTLEAIIPLGSSYFFLENEGAVMDDPRVAAGYARQMDEIRELGEALKAEGSLAPEVPVAWFAAAFDAMIYAAWSAVAEGEIAPKAAGEFAFRTLTRGLAAKSISAAPVAKKKSKKSKKSVRRKTSKGKRS